MIRGLRRRLIAVVMTATFVVLFVMIGGMNLLNFHNLLEDADGLTRLLSDHDGKFVVQVPEDEPGAKPGEKPKEREKKEPLQEGSIKQMPAEMPYATRYFSVLVTAEEAQILDLEHIASVSEEEAIAYAKKIASSDRVLGFLEHYRYRLTETEDGSMVVFVDCESTLDVFYETLRATVMMSAAGYAAVFLLVLLFSGVVLRPVQTSYEKQKRFITDASHELKTPLTIIDANVEILEIDQGENEWTCSIHNQIKRLTSLTNQLVSLARMDEENGVIKKEDFDFSEAVYDVADGFFSVAEASKLTLKLQIAEGLHYKGEEGKIRQLIGILLDNATKYATSGSVIEVSLQKKGRQLLFSVINEAEGLTVGEKPELFERFYRADSSRNSKTGGSGIGLSVAEAIVSAHKGSIRASSPDGLHLQMVVLL